MHIERSYLKTEVQTVLEARKMVFIGGPRQVGKTTFALSLLGKTATERHPGYLNWDNPLIPPLVRRMQLPPKESILIFDEIHKYKQWRNLIKGIYDTQKSVYKLLVTGSARLDYYSRGGDSLVNRYRHFRMHPVVLDELTQRPQKSDMEILLKFGGFPEPLLSQSEKTLRIWQRSRVTRVIQTDLRDLERIRDVSMVEHLADLLPERVGSILSINGIREDLKVDFKTAASWILALENMYLCYRISPYWVKRTRSVKKEKKLYLWDWSMVPDEGARFENMVGGHLLRYCHWIEDTEGFRMELWFLRDTDGREVDFLVTQDGRPLFGVECKSGDKAISQSLRYWSERTPANRWFQVHRGEKHFVDGKIEVIPFWKWRIPSL